MTDDPFASLGPVSEEPVSDPPAPSDDGPPPADHDPREDGPERECAGLPLNDYGNGLRFVRHFGEDLVHVPRVGWYVWTGQRWKRDDDKVAVRGKAQLIGERILREIPHLVLQPWEADLLAGRSQVDARIAELEAGERPESDSPAFAELAELRAKRGRISGLEKQLGSRKREHRSHARSSGNSTKISSMMGEAEVEQSVPLDALDSEALAINTETGVLRFTVTDAGEDGDSRVAEFTISPHRREDRLTKLMPLTYDPDARAERFDAFLRRVQPDPEMRGFLQRWLGLSMTGLQWQQLAFWYGGGANGKSVLADLMARMMGDYSATAKIETLTGRNRRSGGDATPDLVPLIGARMVRASEPEEGERLQEAKIKELTGGEPILVRALNEDFVEVTPIFKLTLSGNHKPEVRGGDDGIWRRLMLVPWEVTIPEEERDAVLGEKLWSERSGILNWLIDGLLQFLEGGLQAPEKVYLATAEYRRESDPVGQFLTDATIFTGDPGDTIRSADLVNMFNYWLLEAGMGQWKPGTVSRALGKKADTWRHPRSGLTVTKSKNSLIQFVGLRTVDAFRRRFELAPKDQSGRPLAVAEKYGA